MCGWRLFFFLFFLFFLISLRAKQIAHDLVVNDLKQQRDAQRDKKHACIATMLQRLRLRHVLQQWKTNTHDILGKRTVHSKLQATQESLQTMQKNARTQYQTIQRLRLDLETATKRNALLEIVAVVNPLQQSELETAARLRLELDTK